MEIGQGRSKEEVGEQFDALHREDVKGSLKRSGATIRMQSYLNGTELKPTVTYEEIEKYIAETKQLRNDPANTELVKEGYKKMIFALEDKMSKEKLDKLRDKLSREGTY